MNKVLSKGKLLDETGNVIETGYANELVKEYNRKDIKANKLRIKEWDYYYFGNHDFGVALTLADNSYLGNIAVSFFDFKHKIEVSKSIILPFTFGKMHMPNTSKTGDINYNKKGYEFRFLVKDNVRHLIVTFPHFLQFDTFKCDVTLTETNKDSMVIVNPFNYKKHFYYNQKINLFNAEGKCSIGKHEFNFKKDNTFGVLDWGRGVWTYKNTWRWCSINDIYEGQRIGFNLGYGFGNTDAASENMFFYDDISYKLDDIVFDIPMENNKPQYLKPWSIHDSKNKINIIFNPILNRHVDINALFIKSLTNQVFGLFSGYIILDDNRKVEFKDLMGFAEKVTNHW